MRIKVFNSFCQLEGSDGQVDSRIRSALSYDNDFYYEKKRLWNAIKYASKRIKDYKIRGNVEKVPQEEKKIAQAKLDIAKLEAREHICWFSEERVFPTGHLDIVENILRDLKQEYELVDWQTLSAPKALLPWKNKPYEPRYYQEEAIAACIEAGRGVVESAVGTGKSLMMAYLTKHYSLNTVIVVPSRGLSTQLYDDFKVWFGTNKVEQITTAKIKKGGSRKPIRLVVVNTLQEIKKAGLIQDLLQDVGLIHIEEVHHSGADSYLSLLPDINHIRHRFGFTGTFLRGDEKTLDMHGFLSNVVYRYEAQKAIADGFLTPLEVKVRTLKGDRKTTYPKEYEANYCGSKEILASIKEICLEANDQQQILILVKNKEKSGYLIHDFLKAYGIECTFISGDDKEAVKKQAIKDFNDKKISILIGSKVIGEGIDIRSTDVLVMAQGGKSEVDIVQALGRAVRLFDGKLIANVYDFSFKGTKYMDKHLEQRKDIYLRNFGVEVSILDAV